ncbi:MAG TPA: hypothetical protein VEI73_04300 [Candidatus Acidoferrum sp.]|nr:hypothetical protein [Candidatus Acidoferrum sp.]
MKHFRSWIPAATVSLATALLIVSPFFWRGNASGHDISFHAASWLDAAGQWKEGIFYPRWCEWANYGFGEPRFLFYPPLSWMLGAALSLVLPGNAVPGVFIVLVQTGAGISMYALARRFFPPRAAHFSCACYAANPYALLIVYMRSDFAELLAWAFLPVLILAALQLSGLIENRWRSWPRVVAVFAVLFAAIWLCNAPAGVMASYSMALVFAWAALAEKSLRPLLRGAAGLALGIGLACFYLVPAAYEQRWVNITQALASGLQPTQNFLYTQINDPEHNLFNWIASSAAILLIVMVGIAALLSQRDAQQDAISKERKELWGVLLLLSAAATILMLRPTAFFWEHLPKLRFVQFPWRWMGILAVAYAFFGAAVRARRRAGWYWGLAVLLVSLGTGAFLVHSAWWDSDDIPSLQAGIANDQGFEGTDEYDPAADDHYNLPQNAPRIRVLAAEESDSAAPKAKIEIQRWTAEQKIVAVDAAGPARVALRLLNYPAWRVEVFHDGKISAAKEEDSNQVIGRVSAGTSVIQVHFARTPDRTAGAITTLAVIMILVSMNWFGRSGRD